MRNFAAIAALFITASTLPLAAQQVPAPVCQQMNCYTASTGQVSLSGAGTAATIQQPALVPFQLVFGVKASVYCSVACTVTRSYGGSKATATAGTVVQSQAQPQGAAASAMLFFTASNASGGTTVDVTNVPAGSTLLFDLSDVVMGTAPNQNYTIAVGSITGTANITYYVGLR